MAFRTIQFKGGSYCIIEGKKDANKFYIIIQGKLRTQKSTPVVGEESTSILEAGDFFGVESAMSNHSRIETVMAMSDCKLIEVSSDQFGLLIQKNAPIAMKIIRSFSMKLRSFDNTIARLSFRNAVEEDPAHLFDLGEFWFKAQRFVHAAYAYQRYLQWCSKGDKVSQAKMRLQAMNKPLKAPPVADSSINRNHRPDDLIFCENEPGYELYIIQTGRVKITKMVEGQEVMLAVLQPGDIFGEMAILDNKPRTATAICAEDSSMLAINKANFENMVKAQPQLATKLITLLSERIWTAYRQLANLMINDPLGRLYDTLLTLAEKDHAKIGARASYHYDIGGKDLLSMVGFDAVKDERLLLDLLKSRWLKLDGGKIICLDLQELEKQVAFYKKKAAVERKREKAAASQ
ncbi:MAG: cyclic nucleotide-binding domain-containing protein [Spirochaetales bacterium]|nr:cyclic nucleotide-binding domain-containing protein [Leptospiraceae bacterium]MCP5483269.1 cyclic nucleotide-binding domain-containing protein [Spirochaetales bacterium]